MNTQPTTRIIEQRAYTAPGYPPCSEFAVYSGIKLIRVVPSIGMAREIASGL